MEDVLRWCFRISGQSFDLNPGFLQNEIDHFWQDTMQAVEEEFAKKLILTACEGIDK
jgi:hypothetical protein